MKNQSGERVGRGAVVVDVGVVDWAVAWRVNRNSGRESVESILAFRCGVWMLISGGDVVYIVKRFKARCFYLGKCQFRGKWNTVYSKHGVEGKYSLAGADISQNTC